MDQISQLTDTYTQVFQIAGVSPDEAKQLSKDYLDQAIKRAAVRLVEKYSPANSEKIIDSVKTNLPTEELIGLFSSSFTDEQLSYGFARGYTEIFGAWFLSVSSKLSEDQKNQIQTLLKNYQQSIEKT